MKITPETAPAGARLLIRRWDSQFEDIFEVTVAEWAPSGSAVRVRYADGHMRWEEKLPAYGVLVERLPDGQPPDRRALTPREAHDLALAIGAEAEAATNACRQSEARRIAAVWRDEGDSEC